MAPPSDSYVYQDLDPEAAETEPCVAPETRVAAGRYGRTAIAAAALLGAAAVAAVTTASLRAAPRAIEAADSVQLSALPAGAASRELELATPQWQITTTAPPPHISQGMNDYFDSEVVGHPVSSLIPEYHQRQDKINDCFENEELFGGLCYLKCSLLTNGTHPVRSSGWTCCRELPCPFEMPAHDVGICSGYSVAGDGMSCPRPPGFCLTNEEKFLGLCYKKCSIITNGEFPYRITPVTCCETKGIKCLHPKRTSWNFAHATGGGENDDDPLTPARPHVPITLQRTQTSTFTPAQVAPPAPEPEFGPVPGIDHGPVSTPSTTTTPSPYVHTPGEITVDSPPVTTSTIEFLMPAPTPAPLAATTSSHISVPAPAPEIVTTTVAVLPFEVPTLPVAPTPAPGDATA